MRLSLTYEPTDEIEATVALLDARRYTIRALVPEGLETIFQTRAQYLSVNSSVGIEGNPLSFEDAYPVLSGDVAPRTPDEHEQRQLNEAYADAYQWGDDPLARIDEGIIRAINSVLLRGDPRPAAESRGKYRAKRVGIHDRASGELRYIAPEPEHVAELMRELVLDIERWRNDEVGPIAAALAHFGIVSVHPFEDGNGRAARLVADMLLHMTDWSIARMVSVNLAIRSTLDEYHRVLLDTQGPRFVEHVDVTPFVEFHLDQLRRATDALEVDVVRINRIFDEVAGTAQALTSAESRRTAVSLYYLVALASISTSQYARLCECSQATASSDLKKLEEVNVVRREGGGRSTRYVFVPRREADSADER